MANGTIDNNNHFSSPEGISLKEYINDKLHSIEKSIDVRFESSTVAVNAALAAAEKAVIKAENAAEKRFESVNEFRSTLSDQQRTLMPRGEFEVQHTALVEKVDLLISGQTRTEGKGLGNREMLAYIVASISIIGAILSFVR